MEQKKKRTNEATRFKKGVSGNPGGKTSAQRKAEVKASELAAKASLKLVESLVECIKEANSDQQRIEFIETSVLKLLKDVQDRAHGTPKQSVDIESPEGTMTGGLGAFYADLKEGDDE